MWIKSLFNKYVIKQFNLKNFDLEKIRIKLKSLDSLEKWNFCGELIFKNIESSKSKNPLLSAVIHLISIIRKESFIYPYRYTFYDFESWLIKNKDEKIVNNILYKIFGQRENSFIKEYQFGRCIDSKIHITTGHINPDKDALVTSFVSWLDSSSLRASKVSNMLNISGSISSVEAVSIFNSLLGEGWADIIAISTDIISPLIISTPWKGFDQSEIISIEDSIIVRADSSIERAISEASKLNDDEFIYISLESISNFTSESIIGKITKESLVEFLNFNLSIRDFSSLQSSHISKYAKVISIVDHHSSSINTNTPIIVNIRDAQSCSAIIANDYLNMHEYHIDNMVSIKAILLLFGIIDDTDSFNKKSLFDFYAVLKIINILDADVNSKLIKSALLDKCCMINSLKQLCTVELFNTAISSAKSLKSISVNESITKAINANDIAEISLFSDTKVNYDKYIIGQIKLMKDNREVFLENEPIIKSKWISKSKWTYSDSGEVLHIMMVSTIDKCEDTDKDFWWFWEPVDSEENFSLQFLTNISKSDYASNILEIVISYSRFKEHSIDMKELLKNLFKSTIITIDYNDQDSPSVVLLVKAGSMNSRKHTVSPYLPAHRV